MIKSKYTIVLASVGLSGHLNPILSIADYLNDLGYKIIILTSQCSIKYVNQKLKISKILGINDGLDEVLKQQQDKQVPFEGPLLLWKDSILKSILDYQIDMIISDFACSPIIKFAKKSNIKLIVNVPGPSQLYQVCNYPNFNSSISFAGFTLITPKIFPILMQYMFPFIKVTSDSFQQSLVFFNSFFGFSSPMVLPPNVKLTGPLLNSSKSIAIKQNLQKWLIKMKSNKLDIIYVTFGSMIYLTQYFFERLYYDLKALGKAVLWSLPQNDIIFPQQNQNFYFDNWLPQVEILKLKEVKLVITHCGWNGVSECIFNEKPMLCVPVCADQKNISEIVQSSGAGLILRPMKRVGLRKPLNDPSWTKKQFQQKANALMGEKFTSRLRILKNLSKESGGLQQIGHSVQNYLKNGNDHLIDGSLNRIRRSKLVNGLKFMLLVFLIAIVISYLIQIAL